MGVKIILNMIMRDEFKAGTLIRGLENLKHIFQYYAVSDTGSVDNSIEELKKWMKKEEKEGIVESHTWEDHFGKNRTYALQIAYEVAKKYDPKNEHTWYAMFQDCDNEAWSNEQKTIPTTDEARKNGKKFPWNRDSRKNIKAKRIEVNMRSGINQFAYTWMICIRDKGKEHPWKWLCSCHEYVDDCGTGNHNNKQIIEGGYVHSGRDGARGKTGISKYWTDAIKLTKELNDPETSDSLRPRIVFYLANSFKDSEWWEKAAYYYERRVLMGGFLEEVFHSYINLFYMYMNMGKPPEVYIKPLFDAMVLFPHRLEAVSKYVDLMISNKRYHEAWHVGKTFLGTPFPKHDLLFVETNLYLFAFDIKMLMCCYWAGVFKVNDNFCKGKMTDDEGKFNIMGQVNAKHYKDIVNRLIQNPNLTDKSVLLSYIRDTCGIWTEAEKSVLYKIVSPSLNKIETKNEEKVKEDEKKEEGPVGILI